MTRETVVAVQGLYYAVTGIWALVHIGSFQKITGPKTDIWLVKTVGALVLVSGAVMAFAGARKRVTREIELLAGASAVAFMLVESHYVARRRISLVYLGDFVVQAGFLGLLAKFHLAERQAADTPVESGTRAVPATDE